MSKTKTLWATIAGILSSVLAFLGIMGCCGLPILAGILTALGIGASQLSFFAAYRWWFIGFAIVSLLFGFYQVYGKRSGGCCEAESNTGCCPSAPSKETKGKSRLFQKIFLWIGAVVITIILILGIKESGSTNTPIDGCCPVEETVQNNTDCCPAPAQPQPAQSADGCCPR